MQKRAVGMGQGSARASPTFAVDMLGWGPRGTVGVDGCSQWI